MPLALLSGVLLAAVLFLGIRRTPLTIRRAATGALSFLIALAATVALVSLVWWAIVHFCQYSEVVLESRGIHLLGLALLALTVAITNTVHRGLRFRAGDVTRAAGGLVWWWLLAVLSSALLPGFSYLFTWPLLSALLAVGWNLWRTPRDASAGRRFASLGLVALPGITLLSPIVLDFYNFALPRPGNLDSQMISVIGVPALLVAMFVGLLRSLMSSAQVGPR